MNEVYEKNLVENNVANDEMNEVIGTVDSFVRKEYLCELKDAEIVPISRKLSGIGIGKNLRLFKLTSLSYSSTDDIYEKIVSIYSALSGFDAKQVLVLESNGFSANLYLGIASNDTDKLGMEFDTFKGSFLGNFPGGKISVLNNTKNEQLINNIFNEPNIKISSVSALTASDRDSKKSIYGIERLVDGMHGKPFTMVLISDSVSKGELSQLRRSLEAMYTELSPFRQYSLSINNSVSENYTESFNMTKSESVTEGISVTENTTLGKSKNKSVATATAQEANEKAKARNQIIGTAASIAAIMSGLGGPNIGLLQGLFYGSSISNVLSSAQTLMNGTNVGNTETVSEGKNYSISFSQAETSSKQEGFSTSKGVSDGSAQTSGKSLQLNYENKSIINLLDVLDKQIKRIQHIEEIGGFACATYFITGDNTTAQTVANMYRSLLGSGNSLCQNNAINIWSDQNKVECLCEYLKRLNHPVFHFESRVGYPTFTASSIVSSDEFPMYASLPQKSICGLPVAICAEFARNVVIQDIDEKNKIEIGHIFHMGREETSKVYLSKPALRGHMFVTGTTGMGKSNFCYGLLNSLYTGNVKFMVVEPAKGEYHKVFGGASNVYTFGTNPNIMPLLKINPFSFPDGIHVSEHIDKLLEIFSSCWSMYAAMPAVLKEAIEAIYKNCGYNLITGRCRYPGKFPTFVDLLDILPKVINKSDFSAEVKGNYIGSLVTRVASLTDGVYRSVFSENEIDNEVLFDENVLIDLSRVGSSETKALIMGLLVMKLQEYRMTHSQMNMPLKHITVLEEAHHLLKSDKGPSSAEGVNLRSMSLEMITNAIAEMRTYGEGFVIADQSPNLMDSAVIRNTNTKVIFKLQENLDRQTIGNALSLTSAQINELSRLECGVAVVYQSNWDNPVLSKIKYFDINSFQPYISNIELPDIDESLVKSQFISLLLKDRLDEDEESSFDYDISKNLVLNAEYIDPEYRKCLDIISRFINDEKYTLSFSEICMHVDMVVNSKALMKSCGDFEDVSAWNERARAYILSIVSLSDDEISDLLLLCINIRINDTKEMKKLFFRYYAFINGVQKCSLKG